MNLIRTSISTFSEHIKSNPEFEALPDFWVEPMPFVPHEREQVRIEDLMDPIVTPFSKFTEKQWATVYGMNYTVDYVMYGKDDEGYYVVLILKGEPI